MTNPSPGALFQDHPSALIPLWNGEVGRSFRYEFSKYIYEPQSTRDDREYLSLGCEEMVEELPEVVAGLKPEQELGFHSRIAISHDDIRHIPMIDLAPAFEESVLSPIASLLREFAISEFAVYRTGRSAHVYGVQLIPESALHKFFARALLLNLPGKAPVVDARWIGHRLYAGFGSLRWTQNTKQYLQKPELVGMYRA